MRAAVACVVVAALGAGFTAGAPGGDPQLELSASMFPTTVDVPATRELVYRLELTTGSTPQQVRVALRLPVYARGGGTPPRTSAPGAAPVGSPVQLVDRPTLEGTGRIVAFEPPLGVAVAGRTPCLRGYPETSPAVVTLDLPAKARATLVARVETGRAAPWPDTDYRLAFAVAVGTPAGKSVIVRPAAPELTGRRGTRIHLRVQPGRRPSAGQPVRIAGALSPAVAGARLTLWHAAVRQPAKGAIYVEGPDFPRDYEQPRRLGIVVTDTRGQLLSEPWVPPRRSGVYGGDYAVWATYRPAAPQQVRERTCPLVLSIR